MLMDQISVGTTGKAELIVAEQDLATIWNRDSQDSFPAVFATSHLVGLMEVAGARALHPLLKEGELSVGVSIDVMHTAATPPGVKVTAQAKFIGMEGKMYLFEVTASDPGGKIGKGTHKRAIISSERLMQGAASRCDKSDT